MPEIVAPSTAALTAHRATAQALLNAEGAALTTLRSNVGTIVRRNSHRTDGALSMALDLRSELRKGLVDTRKLARVVSARSLAKEVEVARQEAALVGISVEPASYEMPASASDVLEADRGATAYAAAALATARKKQASAEGFSLDGIVSALTFRVNRLVATEASLAFNDERRRVEANYRGAYQGTRWFPLVLKIWDATLDRRTCPKCRALDGAVRPIGLDWDGQYPGSPHPSCRCYGAIFFSPIYSGREFAEA